MEYSKYRCMDYDPGNFTMRCVVSVILLLFRFLSELFFPAMDFF